MSSDGNVTRRDGLLTGLRIRDLLIIGSTWLRFVFRSGAGVVSLYLVLVVGLFIVNFFQAQIEALTSGAVFRKLDQAERVSFIVENKITKNVLEFIVDGTGEEKVKATEYFLSEKPGLLSIALILLLYLIPFTASSASFNQTAGDIGTRGLRFLLSRTERSNIFLGRFLSASLFVAASFAVLVSVVTGYLHFKLNLYPGGDLVEWGFQGWLAFSLYALPYIALASWVSCSMKTPFSALAMTYLAAIGPTILLGIVGSIIGAASDMDTAWLSKLMPWGWKFELLSYDSSIRMKSYLAMLGLTFLFLLLGLLTFRKKDL